MPLFTDGCYQCAPAEALIAKVLHHALYEGRRGEWEYPGRKHPGYDD